jgi:hypothetical protein
MCYAVVFDVESLTPFPSRTELARSISSIFVGWKHIYGCASRRGATRKTQLWLRARRGSRRAKHSSSCWLRRAAQNTALAARRGASGSAEHISGCASRRVAARKTQLWLRVAARRDAQNTALAAGLSSHL